MAQLQTLLSGLTLPEGPRWHEGRLWLSDIHSHRVIAMDEFGTTTTIATFEDAPSGLGFLPDGSLLVTLMRTKTLVRLPTPSTDSASHSYADFSNLHQGIANDMVVDAQGRAYVGIYTDTRPGDVPAPGSPDCLVLVRPDEPPEVVVDQVLTPNGATISPDGTQFILAETLAHRLSAFDIAADGSLVNRRVFADTSDALPDGICLDVEGGVWAGGASAGRFLRVGPTGSVTDVIDVPGRWALACMLGGADRRTLFLAVSKTTIDGLAKCRDKESDLLSDSQGWIMTTKVEVPGAGLP